MVQISGESCMLCYTDWYYKLTIWENHAPAENAIKKIERERERERERDRVFKGKTVEEKKEDSCQ
jgi:hypothetical protein